MAGYKARKEAELAERRAAAMELRKLGGSYRDIAAQLRGQNGVSPKYDESVAYDDVMYCLRELNAKRTEAATEVQRLHLIKLEGLWAVYYDKALAGDTFAFDKCMEILDREAKLYGIEPKPTQPEAQNVVNWSPEQWATEAAKRRAEADEALSITTGPA